MSKPIRTTAIGAFVIGGIAIFIAALAVLGSGKFFDKSLHFIAYFEGSVKGLSVGSPVRFRGAQIGTVTDIMLRFMESGGEPMLPVEFELSTEKVNNLRYDNGGKSEARALEIIDKLIQRGVKASLAMDSIVTSQLYVELDFYPDDPIRYVGKNSELREFPTSSSALDRLKKAFKRIPLSELILNIQKAMQGIEALVTSPKVTSTLESLDELTRNANGAVTKLNNDLPSLIKELRGAIKSVSDSSKQIGGAVSSIKQNANETLGGFQEGSNLYYDLQTTLEELKQTANSLNNLSDSFDRNPEALIFGKEDTED